jgi:hypothetical protein
MDTARYLTLFKNKKNVFNYIAFIVILIYFSTTVLDINLGHIFAIILITILLYILANYQANILVTNNEELEYMMNTLLPQEINYKPEYLYLDADFIILYDNVKEIFGKHNITNFYRIIKNTDELLKIKYYSQTKAYAPPINPDILLGETQYKMDQSQYDNAEYSETMLSLSKDLMSDILNYTNGFIINFNLNPTLEWKFLEFVKRLRFLLKRTYNEIKVNYSKEIRDNMVDTIGFVDLDNSNITDSNFKQYI